MIRRLVLLGCVAALVFGCAEVAPPPGGEIDKSPPAILYSNPPNGATDIARSDRVELQFSERVIKPRTGRAFFISPRQIEQPEIKWKGDRVEIVFADSFEDNRTYIVSASGSITDLRGNRFDSAATIAFSTGPSIASGKIGGTVLKGGQPQSGLIAALYDMKEVSDTTDYASLYPTYLAETNTKGKFTLEYLPDEEYRLIVFSDRDRDERFDPLEEPFAVPDRPVVVGGEAGLRDLRMTLTSIDTSQPSILSAQYTGNSLVHLRLSRSVPVALLAVSPSNLVLTPADDSTRYLPALAVKETHIEESSTITGWFGPLDTGTYNLTLTYEADLPPLTYSELQVPTAEDKSPPTIEQFSPRPQQYFFQDLDPSAVFSEPIETTNFSDETITLWDNDTDEQLSLSWKWQDAFHLDNSSDDIDAGRNYRFTITEFEIVDRGGNVLGDSLRSYEFSVLDDDSLGSISGEVNVEIEGKATDPVIVTFRETATGLQYVQEVGARSFVLAVPAGDYLLSGFVDSDGDGELSPGTIYPFTFSETQATHPDTIKVRARFETAGVEFIIR